MKEFVVCEKCGKRLIEKKSDGVWYFVFGRSKDRQIPPPVQMVIYGTVRMKCIRRSCNHWNTVSIK